MAARRITDDDLELYALDRLAEADDAPVEEHLLVCRECRARSGEVG
jgi:predicted anti-sigma-YlaC factor YlaD